MSRGVSDEEVRVSVREEPRRRARPEQKRKRIQGSNDSPGVTTPNNTAVRTWISNQRCVQRAPSAQYAGAVGVPSSHKHGYELKHEESAQPSGTARARTCR